MSSSSENEYFSDGITEEIINVLAGIKGLRVTSRTSAFYFKGKNLPIPEIGKQLRVATILEGSVRLAGNRMRITAQLIEATEDVHFWSETWDRDLADIFAVQDEISQLIAEKLRENSGHFEIEEQLTDRQTEKVDAYTLYMKARYAFNQWNPQAAQEAKRLYEQALVDDARHAPSMVGLANCYSFLATTGIISFEEGWGKCAELTQQALEINKELPSAYYQLAHIAFYTTANFEQAFGLVQKALTIQANHADAQRLMAFLCGLAGQHEQASHHLQLANNIDPMSPETLFYSAHLDYMQENLDAALHKLDRCLTTNPQNIPAHSVKTNCLLLMGRFEEVVTYYDSLPQELVLPAEKAGTCALALAMSHQDEEAAEAQKQLEAIQAQEEGFSADTYCFLFYVQTGQLDRAYAWVQQAKENRQPLLLIRWNDPLAKALKEDPRHTALQASLFPPEVFSALSSAIPTKDLLDTASTQVYKEKLLAYMEGHAPHLDPNLTLRTLAVKIDLNPNQLSWLLNKAVGVNFNSFINRYRVATFKQLANDPAKAHITIMGLAYESGFNSKSVFNAYFKKETGMTPKAFMKG